MKQEFLSTLLVLVLAVAISFWAGYRSCESGTYIPFLFQKNQSIDTSRPSGQRPIRKVRVLDGHRFDIVLHDGSRYLVQLAGVYATPKESKSAVVRLLNEHRQLGHQLSVSFRQYDATQHVWLVDIYYDTGHRLSQWLTSQGLVYNKGS